MKGFEDSISLYKKVKDLIKRYEIKTVIETGTRKGETAISLSNMTEKVITIEIKKEKFEKAKENFKNISNINILYGSSIERLPDAIKLSEKPLLFYLDAHTKWKVTDKNDNPIREELEIIRQYNLSPVITVHDIRHPYRGDLGFNKYSNGTKLTWNHIHDLISEIYRGRYKLSFNDEASRGERGVAFIRPSKSHG